MCRLVTSLGVRACYQFGCVGWGDCEVVPDIALSVLKLCQDMHNIKGGGGQRGLLLVGNVFIGRKIACLAAALGPLACLAQALGPLAWLT